MFFAIICVTCKKKGEVNEEINTSSCIHAEHAPETRIHTTDAHTHTYHADSRTHIHRDIANTHAYPRGRAMLRVVHVIKHRHEWRARLRKHLIIKAANRITS